MKPHKLFACLVTLQLMCGFTLKAAAPQDFREWTDVNGRTMNARLIAAPNAESVKIERQDGLSFTVPLTTFSAADQKYVKAWRAENASSSHAGNKKGPAHHQGLRDPDTATWTLLGSGDQPASTYSKTRLDQIIESINQRFAVREIKTAKGSPLQVRTEPSDLASRIQISGEMPRMSVASFVKEIARANDLGVKIDASGMIVLVDKAPPSEAQTPSLFGVPISQN
ncbi:MAG: hypothetical protein ABW223_04325 [Rariglobus sp.]